MAVRNSYIPEASPKEEVHSIIPTSAKKADTPRYLITLDRGIGDAVAAGLSVVDQIIRNDPDAYGKIDVLANTLQSQVFIHDPRMNRIIQSDIVFCPGLHITQWLRGTILDDEAAQLVNFLRDRHYEGIFPSIVAPGLYFRINSRIMYPNMVELAQNYYALHKQSYMSLRKVVRQMVNRAFGKHAAPIPDDEEVTLYISPTEIQKARQVAHIIKETASVSSYRARVLIVAPDTASIVTRPPTNLLAAALRAALAKDRDLIACILPSYTETTASEKLWRALTPELAGRIFLLSAEPRATLLETTALIEQADVFLTGDTGLMHLAAAKKILRPGDDDAFTPANSVKIIALFGGTSPNYFGYKKRTMIIGKGRKEQMALRPGIMKDAYDPKGQDLFDHITSQEVVDAIVRALSAEMAA